MILVTGADGFLGRRVCRQLAQAGRDFIGADKRPAPPCDITDSGSVARLFESHAIDSVIHLAAMLQSACRLNPAAATRVNVVGSANLLEAAAQSGVRRFVFGSSISVYAAADPPDLYGAGKRYIETYGLTLARANRLDFVALRIATVVGEGARGTASPWRSEIFERPRREIVIPFAADAMLSLVHVEDAARMLVLLATRPSVASPIYDSPAENWRMGDLKRLVESRDAGLRIELREGASAPAPLANGAAFAREFAFELVPLASRV